VVKAKRQIVSILVASICSTMNLFLRRTLVLLKLHGKRIPKLKTQNSKPKTQNPKLQAKTPNQLTV
jgi:hypothetical protein